MAQAIPRDNVLSALKRRYDHQSAEVVLKRAVEAAKLNDKEQYTTEELRSIGQGLQKVGDRLDSVLGELMALTERKSTGSAASAQPSRETRHAPASSAAATPPSTPAKADDVATVEAASPTTLREAVGVAANASDTTTTAVADAATAESASDEASAESSAEGESSETETGETKSRSGRRRK